MRISFKTELKLNNYQRTQLAKHVGVARHAGNWGLNLCKMILDHNLDHPEEQLKCPSAIDLHKLLVKWVKLEGTIKIDHRKIQLPKIGLLKTYEELLIGLTPKTAIISRTAQRWFASFSYEIDIQPTDRVRAIVGVDLGIKTLATLSSGETFANPQPYRTLERQLKRLQKAAGRKVIGSTNRHKANQKLAKKHAKVPNIRQDTLHKLTTHLAKNHGQVVIEDLNVSGMMANRKLAKSIADFGMYEFRRQLTYKCELYGSKLITVNRFYFSSQTCSCCGDIQDMPLKERVFNCSSCSTSIDRDLNAALNLEHQAFILA